MLEGVRPTRADLTGKFGLSQRLSVRIGALLSMKVECTAALLDLLRPGSALEALFLRKEFLAEAAHLDTARLVQLGQDLEAEPTVQEQQGRRVIGLAEELAAEAGFAAPAEPAGGSLALTPVDVDPMAALMPQVGSSAASVMSGEEVSRLKLTLLTGVEPKAKIEALRKLRLASLPLNEKGLLFLRAVSDESPDVRSEAASGLRSLGLDDATAAAVRALADGTEPEKTAAINALTLRAADSGDAERAVVIAALAADLRGAPEPARAARVLAALGSLAPHLARNADFALAVIRIAVHRLFAPQSEVTDAVLDFLQKFGAIAAEPLAKLLWSEADAAPDRRSKGLLYLALSRIPQAAGPERLAQAAARLLAGWNDSDFDCRRASSALIPLGDAGLNALLQAIPSAPQGQRPLLIRLADQVCLRRDVSDDAAERHAQVLVELIRTSRKPARLAALEARSVERAAESTRAELALHVLASAHDYNLDDVVHLSDAFLTRLGKPAIRELHKSVKSSPWPVERGIALRALDAILVADTSLAKEAGESLRLLLDLYKAGKFPDEALLARTLGRIAVLSGAPAAAVRGTTVELRTLLRDHPTRFELLEAYSWAVSSRHNETEAKMNAGMTLLGLLDSRMPEDFASETWTNDGLELRIGRTSTAHTVLIPTLVNGLVRIALSGAGSDLFLEKITHGLLAHWRKVTGGEVMWSPGNVADLAAGLGSVASRRETPLHLRLDVIEALRVKIVHAPVARALGEALGIEESSKRMESLCALVTKDLCGLAVHRDFQDMDDRMALLGSLGRIAARERLSSSSEVSEELRRRCIELLFDGTRDAVPGAKASLVALSEAPGVPRSIRKSVSERLGRT